MSLGDTLTNGGRECRRREQRSIPAVFFSLCSRTGLQRQREKQGLFVTGTGVVRFWKRFFVRWSSAPCGVGV